MDTERMEDEMFRETQVDAFHGKEDAFHDLALEARRARSVEQEQAEKIQHLEEMLRLANDKMTEQVRQARHELIIEAMRRCPMPSSRQERLALFWDWAQQVRDANAPKD